MLQILGVLDLRSHQLRCDALKLINATIAGTATGDLWHVLEEYFRAKEDINEAGLVDAQSLADMLKIKDQDKKEDVPSVSKSAADAEPEDVTPKVIIDDDDNGDTASVTSASSTTSSLKTLAQKKKATNEKYPSPCALKEAQLFYPTSSETMQGTGVNPGYISDWIKMDEYKGYYRCRFIATCQYAAHTHAIVASHIRRIHIGYALGCRLCPTLAWWQGRYWSDHMDKHHSYQLKFEPLVFSPGELKAEVLETELDHYITEDHFTFPPKQPAIPVHKTKPKVEVEEEIEVVEVHQSSKKRSTEEETKDPKKLKKFIGSDLEDIMEQD